MTTGGTAPPPPLTIPPPPIEPLSEDGSSPLSDVEDKDDEHNGLNLLAQHQEKRHDTVEDDAHLSDGDLSEANDTEAETERLYDTPHTATHHRDLVLKQNAGDHGFEHTPTKLRKTTAAHPEPDMEDDDILSERSINSSPPPPAAHSPSPPAIEKLPSPTLDILAEAAANQEAEGRKRKRPSLHAAQVDDAPPVKLAVPAQAEQAKDSDGDVTMADEEDARFHSNSREQSADETLDAVNPTVYNCEDERVVGPDESEARDQKADEPTYRKQTRSGARRQRGAVDPEKRIRQEGSAEDTGSGVAAAEDDGTRTGEDDRHLEADADEAEAAHKNEEELERKRTAYDQLTSIEKRFATFRERLYEERLEQLNREEAMLRADNPTHPEYLAMMQCIDSRRDEKLRIAEKELELHLESLGRWAVARRAQIHSQFYQDVREARERTMAELGQHWYAIQHERRKHANNVPDFGLRYPTNQAQRVRNALSYNKEVSILSGVAKYEGMPAAPDMSGASMQEMEDDFDAMNRGRQPAPLPQQVPRPAYVDYGSVSFGHGLGAAGQQFLEQTAWANPNHPSNAHLLQRQHPAHHDSRRRSPLPDGSNACRHSTQPSHPFSSSTSNHGPNQLLSEKHGARLPSSSPEVARAASMLEQTSARSRKAAAAAAAAAEQATAIKRETALPVGNYH
ncbi:transcriptional regulatory protein DEP1 [Apiospora phragmitis]|uniref:Transcriptional regulatory protein DEP1 n=1 Tax=Apiospora phragmitis TaxID=2905665 RepID=A0ABR1TSL6_9PEZI